jgi:adenosylhomocysteinase
LWSKRYSHRVSASRIAWVARSCRLLASTAAEFDETKPFAGVTIGASIHLEPKTAALMLTLQRGGAAVVSTGNLNTTQPDTVAYLRAHGIDVRGEQTTDPDRHASYLDEVVAVRPDLLLDNGGDLFARYAADPWPQLLGGTEETTSGRMRLMPLREAIGKPVLVINDSPIKQFAENRHGVGQSVLESFLRFTNRATNGRHVTVFGYGACGRGVAACFRNAFSVVSVVDADPVATLEAQFDGFLTPTRQDALRSADVVITVTGAEGVFGVADLPLLKNDVILANAGHVPWEITVDAIEASEDIARSEETDGGITTWYLVDGRVAHLLGRGHMVNLAGRRPLGNSIESMDLGFTLQARCLEAITRGNIGSEACVVPVPPDIDEQVASAYLELTRIGR